MSGRGRPDQFSELDAHRADTNRSTQRTPSLRPDATGNSSHLRDAGEEQERDTLRPGRNRQTVPTAVTGHTVEAQPGSKR